MQLNSKDKSGLDDTINTSRKPELRDLKYMNDIFKQNVGKVIKVQALWRRRAAQKVAYNQSEQYEGKYFKQEESKETISSTKKYNPKALREDRPTYMYQSGAAYKGQWIGGFRDGYGIQVWPDGAKYEGNWKDNRAFGRGKFNHVDGDIYDGNWANDKANGYGVYVHKNGARYEGYWKDDLQHGKGKEIWTDGSYYDGYYEMGKKQGKGSYLWSDCSKYDGDWFDNKIHGFGIYTWIDGRKYQGEWRENNMNGYGIYFWPDGRKYEGQYCDDKKHGYGVYIWVDGRMYQGQWHDGKQHGLGVYSVMNPVEIRFGLWEEGKRLIWFDNEQVQQIKEGKLDYHRFFQLPQNAYNTPQFQNNTALSKVAFEKPEGFQEAIQRIIELGKQNEDAQK